jgi:hypothetical protein
MNPEAVGLDALEALGLERQRQQSQLEIRALDSGPAADEGASLDVILGRRPAPVQEPLPSVSRCETLFRRIDSSAPCCIVEPLARIHPTSPESARAASQGGVE